MIKTKDVITPACFPKPGYGTFWRYQPVMAVGTAMIVAQLVTFFMIRFIRLPCSVRLVSTIVVTRSRRDSCPFRCPNNVVVDVPVIGRHFVRHDTEVPVHQRVDDLGIGKVMRRSNTRLLRSWNVFRCTVVDDVLMVVEEPVLGLFDRFV